MNNINPKQNKWMSGKLYLADGSVLQVSALDEISDQLVAHLISVMQLQPDIVQFANNAGLTPDHIIDSQLNLDPVQKLSKGCGIEKLENILSKRLLVQLNEQNGDLMFDPEIRIKIYPKLKMIEALTYRNDYVHVYQEVYTQFDEFGNGTHFNPHLKIELNKFLGKWLITLKKQGFKKQTAEKAIQDVEDYLFS